MSPGAPEEAFTETRRTFKGLARELHVHSAFETPPATSGFLAAWHISASSSRSVEHSLNLKCHLN